MEFATTVLCFYVLLYKTNEITNNYICMIEFNRIIEEKGVGVCKVLL